MDEILLTRLCFIAQHELDVNRFRFRGVHVWPIFRTFFVSSIRRPYNMAFLKDPGYGRLQDMVELLYSAVCARMELPRPELLATEFRGLGTLRSWPAAASRQGIMVFSIPDDYFAKTDDGRHTAPMVDPWVDRLWKRIPVTTVQMHGDGFSKTMPRKYPLLLRPPMTDAEARRYAAEITPEDELAVRELATEFLGFLTSRCGLGIAAQALYDAALQYVKATYIHKRGWDGVLELARPAVLLLTSYYYPLALGLMWSCRDHGILSVEAQHGRNGDTHFGYTHWSSMPSDGYAVLPDLFLNWGVHSANNVERWLPQSRSHHGAAVGGRPDFQRAGAGQGANAARLKDLKSGYAKIVLVSLSFIGVDELLIEAIRRAPPDWLWMIRSHPLIEKPEEMALYPPETYHSYTPKGAGEILQGAGVTNFDTDLANMATLDELLCCADHHVTCGSSTVIEAACSGVPTTLRHPIALRFFGSILANRQARYADTADALVASVAAGWDGLCRPTPETHIAVDPAWSDAVIEALLAKAQVRP